MDWQQIFFIAFGSFNILLSLYITATGSARLLSFLVFKAIPFFCGLILFLIGVGAL